MLDTVRIPHTAAGPAATLAEVCRNHQYDAVSLAQTQYTSLECLRADMEWVGKLCNVIDDATQLADDWDWREADRDYRLEVMSGAEIKQYGLVYGSSLALAGI